MNAMGDRRGAKLFRDMGREVWRGNETFDKWK